MSEMPVAARAARIQELATRLLEAEAELRALTADEVDAVIDPVSAQPLLLRGAQEALREAEARARELISRLPIIACELTPDGTTRFVNETVTAILGFEPAELVGQAWWSAVAAGAVDGMAERLAREEITGRPHTVRARNGEHRVVEWTSKNLYDAAGALKSILLFGVDVTERRRAEESARQLIREQVARAGAEAAERRSSLLSEASRLLSSALRYEATLTSIARLAVAGMAEYCIIDLVENGDIRRIDVAHPDLESDDPLRETLAVESPMRGHLHIIAEVIESGIPRLVTDMTRESASAVADAYLVDSLAGRSLVCAPLEARGSTLGAITLLSARGRAPYGSADFAMFTELARRAALAVDNARLYESALTASQAKSDFLAVMSHELRTPLNAILGYSELMLLGVPQQLPSESTEQVRRVQVAARHLLQMIDEILTLSRVEAGEETVEREEIEFCSFLRETAQLMEALADEKRLMLRCETPDDEVLVTIDPRKVRQILLNLLGNAVKFTNEGGILLRCTVSPGELTVIVQDTGEGIAEEHLERIFDPFWQVEQQRTRRRDGAGLGLNVARRLARLMGGDVTVSSVPGSGTRFVLNLPHVVSPPGS